MITNDVALAFSFQVDIQRIHATRVGLARLRRELERCSGLRVVDGRPAVSVERHVLLAVGAVVVRYEVRPGERDPDDVTGQHVRRVDHRVFSRRVPQDLHRFDEDERS